MNKLLKRIKQYEEIRPITYKTNSYLIMFAIFIMCLIVANIIASKLIMIGRFVVPVAVIVYPITFLITDITSEIWGTKATHRIVLSGFLVNLIMVVILWIAVVIPPAQFWNGQEAFKQVLGGVARIVFASMIAYIVSQTHDVYAFQFWRSVTNGKWLWLRNNASTMVSQLLDTLIFIFIAFYGVVPKEMLVKMIISQYAIKWFIALADTPFCYLLRNILLNRSKLKIEKEV